MATTFSKKKSEKIKTQNAAKDLDIGDLLLDGQLSHERIASSDLEVITLSPDNFYVDEQVRRAFEPHEIKQRAASMKTNGQLQPIIVYPADTQGQHKGKHKIDKGECRWRAAQLIDGFKLNAIVDTNALTRNKQQRIIGQIVENDQRADLQPLELAQALFELTQDGMNQEAIAIDLGWITKTNKPNINKVSRILSILKLPEVGQSLASDGIVTDLISLELLRKINEVNSGKFTTLCEMARSQGGLTRKFIEDELVQCKRKVATKQFSHERMNHNTVQKNQRNISSKYPIIEVEWMKSKKAIIKFGITPEQGDVCIQLDETNEIIAVEFKQLQILSIRLINGN